MEISATSGSARAGVVTTHRGSFRTPCFMPVGTRASVKALSSLDMEELGAEVILANTYHLMLRPGAELIAEMGGIGSFSAWPGQVLSDSGGYQVFSLTPRIDDDGVTFRSVYDGSEHRLTPEDAVRIQELLGADIQMVLDVCAPWPSSRSELRLAVERTTAWACRAKAARRRDDQGLFGIVQGGTDSLLRAESAQRTVEIGFDGYGVGGLSVGEPRSEMLSSLAAAIEHLPTDRPRYLMGLGDPVGMVEAVALGVDMFDCVLPTRLARHGTVLTSAGRIQLRNAQWANDPGPLDPNCECPVCARWSRAYLRHLVNVGEPSASRLLSWHNLAWTLDLMARVRSAVCRGGHALDGLRREIASVWG
ncbi:MAG: tRNA guanosine(34) transglycosylase Tgt [Acidimicrobiales bacterium]